MNEKHKAPSQAGLHVQLRHPSNHHRKGRNRLRCGRIEMCSMGQRRHGVLSTVIQGIEPANSAVSSTTPCGIFGTDRRNSADPLVRRGGGPLKASAFSEIPAFLAGAGLALRDGEHHVFRAALFSIVLTLAVGQNASLLCKVWCHDATSAGCPHQDSTTSQGVSADGNCGSTFVGPVAFVREGAWRTAAAPDAQSALIVPRFRWAPSPPTDLGSGFEAGRRLLLDARPLILPLRI